MGGDHRCGEEVPEAGLSGSSSLKLEGSFSLCTIASQRQRGCRRRVWGGGRAAVGLESLEGSVELSKEEGTCLTFTMGLPEGAEREGWEQICCR